MKNFRAIALFIIGVFSLICIYSANAADATWTASSGEVSGYNLHYGTTSGEYPNVVDVGLTLAFLNVDSSFNLVPGITYFFIVKGYNDAGEGGASNIATYTPALPVPLLTPTGLTSDGTVISWDYVPDVDGYRIYWEYNGQMGFEEVLAPSTSYSSNVAPVYGVTLTITSFKGDVESEKSESIVTKEPLQVPGNPTNLMIVSE